MQQQLQLYTTFYMMPLGLIKNVITWFSAHLSEDETKHILHDIIQKGSLIHKPFASLLQEWFRIGYLGKTSVENFRMGLQNMFKNEHAFQIKEAVESSSLISTPISAGSDNKEAFYSSSSYFHLDRKYQPFKLTPQTTRNLHPTLRVTFEKGTASTVSDPIPIDLIFLFHKALKKDLEYLVSGSAQLADNPLLLMDFHRRFHLIRFLYQIHSDAEDEIAFPALEAKGKLRNISHSYSIDHRLESEKFRKISHILNEMVELQVSVDPNTQDQATFKYHRLCIRLHEICKSMHKLLVEHVHREEYELWPLFRECFSIKEQEKIIESILGRMRAETLQDMIPWLMASLAPEEQDSMMSLWLNATKYTMFEEWLGEWWEGYAVVKVAEKLEVAPKVTALDPLEIISTYLSNDVPHEQKGELFCEIHGNFSQCNKPKGYSEEHNNDECSEFKRHCKRNDERTSNEKADNKNSVDREGQIFTQNQKCKDHESLCLMNQKNLVSAIRKVSRDPSLDPQRKSYVIQNLLMRLVTCFIRVHSEARALIVTNLPNFCLLLTIVSAAGLLVNKQTPQKSPPQIMEKTFQVNIHLIRTLSN